MERMGREMTIEDPRESEFDLEARERGNVIDTIVSQFQGSIRGDSPTKTSGTGSLYRGSVPGRKIQEKKRRYENYE